MSRFRTAKSVPNFVKLASDELLGCVIFLPEVDLKRKTSILC